MTNDYLLKLAQVPDHDNIGEHKFHNLKVTYAQRKFKDMKKLYQCDNCRSGTDPLVLLQNT